MYYEVTLEFDPGLTTILFFESKDNNKEANLID